MRKKSIFRIILSMFVLLCANSIHAEKVALLVSLGMPDNALRAYLRQAEMYQIPVVIRGLYTEKHNKSSHPYVGSFKDTVHRIKQLIGESNVGGVSINPLLFRSFGVHVVPALVVYDEKQSCLEKTNHSKNICPENSFDVVFGNLPLEKQLKRVYRQSLTHTRSAFAQHILLKHTQAISTSSKWNEQDE